jgi:hypothetical protein
LWLTLSRSVTGPLEIYYDTIERANFSTWSYYACKFHCLHITPFKHLDVSFIAGTGSRDFYDSEIFTITLSAALSVSECLELCSVYANGASTVCGRSFSSLHSLLPKLTFPLVLSFLFEPPSSSYLSSYHFLPSSKGLTNGGICKTTARTDSITWSHRSETACSSACTSSNYRCGSSTLFTTYTRYSKAPQPTSYYDDVDIPNYGRWGSAGCYTNIDVNTGAKTWNITLPTDGTPRGCLDACSSGVDGKQLLLCGTFSFPPFSPPFTSVLLSSRVDAFHIVDVVTNSQD